MVSSRVIIPLIIYIGISCINYAPLIVPEIRNRSPASGKSSKGSGLLSSRAGPAPAHRVRGRTGWCAVLPFFQISRCLRCAVRLRRAFSIRPELNVFRGDHKVPLTLKIHSSGFIHWSEVARAPKTNRGSKECGWGRAAMARCPGHITLDSYSRPYCR